MGAWQQIQCRMYCLMMQGKLFTSIEAAADFNGFCLVPNTGMIFAANEDTKIQTYYIPVSTSCS